MSDAFGKAIEGMVTWAEDYLAKAKAEVDTTSQKMQGGFTADDAVETAARLSNLWFNGITSFASEMMDAATLTAKYSAAKPVTTNHMKVNKPGTWHLTLKGPATCKANDKQELPESALTLVPTTLDGQADTWAVTANILGKRSGVYEGTVTATAADGSGSVELTYHLVV